MRYNPNFSSIPIVGRAILRGGFLPSAHLAIAISANNGRALSWLRSRVPRRYWRLPRHRTRRSIGATWHSLGGSTLIRPNLFPICEAAPLTQNHRERPLGDPLKSFSPAHDSNRPARWQKASRRPPVINDVRSKMGSFRHPRVFDPLDLEISDRVCEAAWAQLEAREPFRGWKV